MGVHCQGHLEVYGVFHFLYQQLHDGFLLGPEGVDDQLIVHLKDQLRFQSLAFKTVLDLDHGDFNDVRG